MHQAGDIPTFMDKYGTGTEPREFKTAGLQFADCLSQHLCDELLVTAEGSNGKFVAAQAMQYRFTMQFPAQGMAKPRQQLVATFVPEFIVIVFEAVEVKEGKTARWRQLDDFKFQRIAVR